jgi:hypothetical protein
MEATEDMAVHLRKPQPQPAAPTATSRIESAQSALEEANRKLAELNEQRNQCLLKDDNAGAVALGIEAANLRLVARAEEDRIALLREAAVREEQARKAEERAAQIERIEAKIRQRDKVMEEVATAIKQLATASERAMDLNRDIIAAWSWAPHDLPPALLTPPSILAAISHESFRVSYHPRRYGGVDTDVLAGLGLPGARAPTLQLLEDPARVRPMVEVVRDASEFARQFLRTGKGSAAHAALEGVPHQSVADVAPGATTNGTEAPVQRLAALLKQQAELAEDPTREAEYQSVVAAIAQAQTEVDAARRVETQHGR